MKVRIVRKGRSIATPKNIVRDLEMAYDDEVKQVKRDFESTTATWREPVKFTVIRKSKGVTEVVTDNPIYGYVDKGTRPHIIRPKQAGYPLRFKTAGFRPKTAPRRLGSSAGSPAQAPEAYAMEVHHPGTDARDFSDIIATMSEFRLKKRIDKVLATFGKER